MMGTAQDHLISLNIAYSFYDLYTLSDRCVGPHVLVRDVQHTSFQFKDEKEKVVFI